MESTPKVGAYVLETLTTGMYANPLDSLREYIQNAADSIRKAIGQDIIHEEEGQIVVTIDREKRSLSIADNGVGISYDEAYARLVNIGMSNKRIEVDAGFRGIGRLAGIAYCDTIIFKTSRQGEKKASEINIDCIGIRESISPARREIEELSDVMAKYCRLSSDDCKPGNHYFEVIMEGIHDEASIFLNSKDLEDYLCQVAPVKFDAQKFVFATKIRDWLKEHGISLPTVNLLIKDSNGLNRQVFKPFKKKYRTARSPKNDEFDIEIKEVCFYPEGEQTEHLCWVWYGKSELVGMISDPLATGLRFKKNNIQVGGPEGPAALFKQTANSNERFNYYYIGEIHILSSRVIPNARRDGFEDGGDWPVVKKELMPFIEDRCAEVRATSDARTRPVQKIAASANKIAQEAQEKVELGIVSPEEKEKLIQQVQKEKKIAETAIDARKGTVDEIKLAPIVKKLEKVEAELSKENNYVPSKLRTDLDRKQRRIIEDVLKILYDTLDEATYRKAHAAIMERFQNGKSED